MRHYVERNVLAISRKEIMSEPIVCLCLCILHQSCLAILLVEDFIKDSYIVFKEPNIYQCLTQAERKGLEQTQNALLHHCVFYESMFVSHESILQKFITSNV